MTLTKISTGGIKDDAVGVDELSATGTASSSTFLRGDNSWSTPSGGMSDVVADTTPQLGGDLDVNGNSIISSATDGDIELDPNGTGDINLKTAVGGTTNLTSGGDVVLSSGVTNAICQWDYSQYQLEFWDGVKASFGSNEDFEIWHDATDNQIKGNSGKIVVSTTANNDDIEITPHGTGDVVIDGLKYPQADGSAGQVLKTDGSAQLSWTTPLSLANDANNRVVTGTGSGLNGEANLTFDGDNLIQTINSSGEGIQVTTTGDVYPQISLGANRGSENHTVAWFEGKWNGTSIGGIAVECGDDTTNKDDGKISFYTTAGGTQTKKMAIEQDGDVEITDGDLVIGTAGHGIDFSNAADTASDESVGGSVLADYEEGTWTPSFNALSAGSVSVTSARYVKVGKMVHVQSYVTVNSSSTNAFEMSMPFQHAGGSSYSPLSTQMGANTTASIMRINTGSTQAFMRNSENGDTVRSYANLSISDGMIIFAGTYEAVS